MNATRLLPNQVHLQCCRVVLVIFLIFIFAGCGSSPTNLEELDGQTELYATVKEPETTAAIEDFDFPTGWRLRGSGRLEASTVVLDLAISAFDENGNLVEFSEQQACDYYQSLLLATQFSQSAVTDCQNGQESVVFDLADLPRRAGGELGDSFSIATDLIDPRQHIVLASVEIRVETIDVATPVEVGVINEVGSFEINH